MSGCRILIVDDEHELATLCRETLRLTSPDLRIDTATEPRKALQMLEDNHYAMVITDLGIGKGFIGGVDIIKAAKEKGAYTVLFSGVCHKVVHGADFRLPKPPTAQDFSSLLAEFNKAHKTVASFKDRVFASYRVINLANSRPSA